MFSPFCTSKTVNGVTYEFLNLNGRVAHQFWTENGVEHRLDFIYDQQGKPLTLRYKAGSQSYIYYCLTNLQGDVIKLYQAKMVNGELVTTEIASYTYDAWGNVTNITQTAADTQDMAHLNPIRYRGYYQDVETGFYYLESRYVVVIAVSDKSTVQTKKSGSSGKAKVNPDPYARPGQKKART